VRADRAQSESGHERIHAPQQTAPWFDHQIGGKPRLSPFPCIRRSSWGSAVRQPGRWYAGAARADAGDLNLVYYIQLLTIVLQDILQDDR
jgi:hypothetical protein